MWKCRNSKVNFSISFLDLVRKRKSKLEFRISFQCRYRWKTEIKTRDPNFVFRYRRRTEIKNRLSNFVFQNSGKTEGKIDFRILFFDFVGKRLPLGYTIRVNPCTFVPIDLLFQIENTKSQFLCFSIFKYKLKIENHPFFLSLSIFQLSFRCGKCNIEN